jgi:hypothetical protein
MSLDIDLYTRVYEANITHNLGTMAKAAGIYDCLWRAPENGFTLASQLVEPLTKGIAKMEATPKRFKAMNSPNGWGTYENFLPWLERLLDACIANPDAEVRTDR